MAASPGAPAVCRGQAIPAAHSARQLLQRMLHRCGSIGLTARPAPFFLRSAHPQPTYAPIPALLEGRACGGGPGRSHGAAEEGAAGGRRGRGHARGGAAHGEGHLLKRRWGGGCGRRGARRSAVGSAVARSGGSGKWLAKERSPSFGRALALLISPSFCCAFLGLVLLAQAAAARRSRMRYPPPPKLRGRTARSTRMLAQVRSEVICFHSSAPRAPPATAAKGGWLAAFAGAGAVVGG